MLLDIARTYVRKATWMADNRDKGWDPALAAFPKVFASQAAWKIATWASEIHGGYGFMRELGSRSSCATQPLFCIPMASTARCCSKPRR